MRINSDLPIQNTGIQNAQRSDAGSVRSSDAAKDVVSINSGTTRLADSDRGIKASQDAMTLFRIAEDSLSKVESFLMKMGELAYTAANGQPDASESDSLQFEMNDLIERIDFAAGGATVGGVPVFGGAPDTGAMWNSTAQNVDALSPMADNSMIFSLPAVGVRELGLDATNLSTRKSAGESLGWISDAIAKVTLDRTVAASQANRMGAVASELAMSSLKNFSSVARITDAHTAAGLMAFVGRAVSESPDASFAAQANLAAEEIINFAN